MTLTNLNSLPVEFVNLDNSFPLAFVILGLFSHVLWYIFLDWDAKIYSFLLGSKRSTIREQEALLKISEAPCKQLSEGPKEKIEDDESMFIWREEVETVLKRLEVSSSFEPRPVNIEEKLDSNELCSLFEEKEASLDEVKAAFDVFDENKDGFIDPVELQRLLRALGFKEGLELDNCMRMIKVADEDGDGMIDFNEFAKFMENS